MSSNIARRVGALGLAMVISLLASVGWQTSAHAQSTGPSSFGFAANGMCQVGECPPTQPLGEADVSIPIDFTFSLASGDRFRIVGTQNQANHNTCVTAFSARRQWSIQYVGNSKNSPSQADTFNLEVWLSWNCNLRNAKANWDIGGSFSPGIAPGSSFLAIFDRGAASWTFGPYSPGQSFNQTVNDSGIIANGPLVLHQQYTVTFDEGSALCSYIVLGNRPAQCTAQQPAAAAPPANAPDHDVRPLSGHIDRSTGGHLESDDHKVWVDVPASDEQNSVDVRVALKKSDTDAPATVSVGAMNLAVMIDDDSGAPVTKFNDPLQVTVKPYDDDVAAAGGDPSQLSVSQLDPDGSGAAVPVPYAANSDGSVTLQLARLAR